MKKHFFTLLLIAFISVPAANSQNFALAFDGINDHVTLPAALWNNNFSNGSAITVEYWYKKGETTTDYTMNSVYRVQTGSYFVAGYYGSGGSHLISSSGSVSAGNNATINDGNWHHMAMTWSRGGYFTSYFDGVQYAQVSAGSNYLPAMDVTNYLASYNNSSEYLNGSLDDIRIWNDVRTAQEIADNKDHELTGSEAGLVAYYKMSNGTGTSLTDNTSAGLYPGTLVNGVAWTNGAVNSSLSTSATFTFNATTDLTSYFNSDGTPVLTNSASGGLGNTGAISIQANNNELWTEKTAFSNPAIGNTYTVSAYFYNVGGGGYGGIGFAAASQNIPNEFGSPPILMPVETWEVYLHQTL
jgi:hypothetical protein